MLIVAMLAGFGTAAQGAVPTWSDGIFELDGNTPDGPSAGTDWNALYPNGTGAAAYSFTTDPAPQTIFTTGGSKDEQDISSWRWKNGSVPDKDDITNAFAAAFTYDNPSSTNDDVILTFGLDRLDNSGDANAGFWFLKGDIPDTLPANGTFGTNHQVGDVLVLSSFTNGGQVSTIQVLEWDPAHASPGLNNLRILYTSSQAECGASATANACGIANKSPQSGDAGPLWSYTAKGGAEGAYQTAGFFEGAINLTQLFLNTNQAGSTPCFSSFVSETRSSSSVSATLKDFTADSFDLCTANLAASPLTATNGIGEKHTVTMTATKSVLGSASTVADVGHVDYTLVHSAGGAITTYPAETTCHNGAAPHTADNLDANGQCTITFSSNVAGTVTVNGSASIDIGGGSIVTAATTGTSGNTGPAQKIFLDGSLQWLKHDGNGALLGGATFKVCRTHNWNSDTSQMDLIVNGATPPVATPVCTTFVDNASPDNDPTAGELELIDLVLGRYTIEETVAPTGYVLDDTVITRNLTTADTDGEGTFTFVNVALYKMIVITCNTASEELVTSSVTQGGATKDTLKDTELGGLSETAICGLPAATFDDLAAGTYNPSVVIPKP